MLLRTIFCGIRISLGAMQAEGQKVQMPGGGHYFEVGDSLAAIAFRCSTIRLEPHALIVLHRKAIAPMVRGCDL